MNLQTVVDTLQEVRALRGPTRERLRESHVAQGHGLQGAKLGAVPSIAPTRITSCSLNLSSMEPRGSSVPPASELGRD